MRLPVTLFSIIVLLFLLPNHTAAQDTVPKKQNKKSAIYSTAKELTKSLSANDDAEIAKNYEQLANGFVTKSEWQKAEEYFQKALTLYSKMSRLNDQSRVRRSLAQVQESQNKLDAAARNFKEAEVIANDKSLEQLNSNDYNRLKNSDPKIQEQYVESNINLLGRSDKKGEVADAYMQKAEISLKNNDKKDAIVNYEKALVFADSKPEKLIEINNQIAKVYASDNKFDKAIAMTTTALQNAQKKGDFDTQISQLQTLSSIYFKQGESAQAVKVLRQSYDIAFENGRTSEVKKSLALLVNYYKSTGDKESSMDLYEKFFADFDQLIESDSTLIDAKTFKVTEEKIRQLENEKRLKDELINRKNTFNYVLLGSVLLLLLFFFFIVKALYSIKTKNKEIALQSLRREMNPHFIFNSLNSINQFISQNNELEANKYLSNYSILMRSVMENSNKDFVSLSNEIEQLNKYLELEHMRFRDKFNYKITVDEQLDTESTYIPNMIIQPHLENAIWHGLRYKDEVGLLELNFKLVKGKVIVTIDDDGIGLSKSAELKTQNQKVHQSRGITNAKERMALLNQLYKKEISFTLSEKSHPETGTTVQLIFPLINKI